MKNIILLIIICMSLTCCNKPKVIEPEQKISENKLNAQKSSVYSANNQKETNKLTDTKIKLISETKIKNELNSFKNDLNIATGAKPPGDSEDLKNILKKSIQFWSENEWAIFKTQFDFNNTNNMEKLESIYSKLSCAARSFNKATRENIINNFTNLSENISEPTMRNSIIYICADLYWRGRDYDNSILLADALYNDCVKSKDLDTASGSVTLKMKSFLKQNKPENVEPLVNQWEKDFPNPDFDNYFRVKRFAGITYFSVDVDEKINQLKGIKILVSLLNDNRLNQSQKQKVESLYESYKELPVCAEYLKKVNYINLP